MKTDMRITKILGLAAMLVLVGAGCQNSRPAATNQPEDDASTEQAETTIAENGDAAVIDEATDAIKAVETNVTIDDTWQTYVSRAKDWQFNWPTKGRHAPQWDMSFTDEVTDGCHGQGAPNRLRVGDTVFCHTSERQDNKATDFYVANVGGSNVLLTFTKDASSYEDYNWQEYGDFLDQIVSTFKTLK